MEDSRRSTGDDQGSDLQKNLKDSFDFPDFDRFPFLIILFVKWKIISIFVNYISQWLVCFFKYQYWWKKSIYDFEYFLKFIENLLNCFLFVLTKNVHFFSPTHHWLSPMQSLSNFRQQRPRTYLCPLYLWWHYFKPLPIPQNSQWLPY